MSHRAQTIINNFAKFFDMCNFTKKLKFQQSLSDMKLPIVCRYKNVNTMALIIFDNFGNGFHIMCCHLAASYLTPNILEKFKLLNVEMQKGVFVKDLIDWHCIINDVLN